MWPFDRKPSEAVHTFTVELWKVRPAVQAIIDLLRDHPEEWTFSGHDATHALGARVHVVCQYRWTTTLALPGLAEIVRETEPRKETDEQKALFAALRAAQDALFSGAADAYLARATEHRGDRRRYLLESARRAEHDAEGLRIAAERAVARATKARRDAEA